MQRRDYIRTTGVLVGAGIVGSTTTKTTAATQNQDQFELVDITAPDEVEAMTPFSYSYTVANTGETDAELWAQFTINAYGESYDELDGVMIPAGEEVTVERNNAFTRYLGTIEIRFHRFDESIEFESVPATREFGATWRSPDHTVITVEEVELMDTYEYDDNGERAEESAGSGSQWAFVWLQTENVARENTRLPRDREFEIITDEGLFDSEWVLKDDEEYESDTVTPGESRRGWIAYEINSDVGVDDITVRYEDDGFEGVWEANWMVDLDDTEPTGR